MNRNVLQLVKLATRQSSHKVGMKYWPKPQMLGPQTAKHFRFPGWALYWWPTDTYNGKKLFFVVLLFQFTGLTVPVLGVYKMLWTLYGSQET